MANNLFVSYDLYKPGQDYDKVIEAIKSLGAWAKVHYSFWYVNSQFTASEASKKVWAAMDKNDSLIVVDASNNYASWYNLKQDVLDFIKNNWHK